MNTKLSHLLTSALLLLMTAGCGSSSLTTSTAPVSQDQTTLQVEAQSTGEAPLRRAEPNKAIRDRYIVVFKNSTRSGDGDAAVEEIIQKEGGKVHFQYRVALNGFAATLSPRALALVRRMPSVDYVEEDAEFSIAVTQNNATWGLDRIDQRSLPLNTTYTYTQTGSGVNAYIIDTGIRSSHRDFSGRVASGFSAISDGNGSEDCNGHGTHVAGTVGSDTYGVAKRVKLYPVRVFDCTGRGTTSNTIAGVEWVTANHVKPAVTNMSLGGSASTASDTAVNNSINAGITYVVAAGNSNRNACDYSPARVSNALTVGATAKTDARASFSNYGRCLDLFAPGQDITSTWYTSTLATNTISGTSMASPHVAGAVALYLQTNPGASPAQVNRAILDKSTANVVTNPRFGSPNGLLYVQP
jgi:subtilisin family serine protease